ncbi:uncharacterized protein LOC107433675 [Ziziphus jujuba]|uniref:Uncharacterized protein LOC107433675 n=1 Tax=Ziziphus jujuba TaxID=326968 RepID=A0A6P4APX2_ZIZJJ|nr:uncharacterized protein LOC107433675 [Ziziphus jujuba]
MSWLARSLTNSLRLDDDDDEDDDNDVVPDHGFGDLAQSSPAKPHQPHHHQQQEREDLHNESEVHVEDEDEEEEEEAHSRGVKEDLSEFKQTLTRQFWGVASFLAPPPSQPSTPSNRLGLNCDRSEPFDQSDQGTNMSSKGEEEDELEYFMGRAVGITEEVLAFARNIAMHPETWLDFPGDEEENLDDFNMSVAQQDHVFVIEHLAPRLAALRIELCPCHMSENYFWKVYFVLLHSRLNKQDAETLSTAQVMAARSKWMQELQSHSTSDSEWLGGSKLCLKENSNTLHQDLVTDSSFSAHFEDMLLEPSESTMPSCTTYFEPEKHPVGSSEWQFIDKSVIEERSIVKTQDKNSIVGPSSKILVKNNDDDDDDDDWPEEDYESHEYGGGTIHVVDEEDISFSDLEDDNFHAPRNFKTISMEHETPTKDP